MNKKRNHKYTRKIGQSGGFWFLEMLKKRKANAAAIKAANAATARKATGNSTPKLNTKTNLIPVNETAQQIKEAVETKTKLDAHEDMLKKLLDLTLNPEHAYNQFLPDEITKIKEIGRKEIDLIEDYCSHINSRDIINKDECRTVVLNIKILAIAIKEKEDKERIDDALKNIKNQGMQDALIQWKLKKALALQEAKEEIKASSREEIELERVRHVAALKEVQDALEYEKLEAGKNIIIENDRLQKNQQKENVDANLAAKAARLEAVKIAAAKAAILEATKAAVIKNAYKRKIAAYDKKIKIRNIAKQYLTENPELNSYLKKYNNADLSRYMDSIKIIKNTLKIYPNLNIKDATDSEIFSIEVINYSIEKNIDTLIKIIEKTYNKRDSSLAQNQNQTQNQNQNQNQTQTKKEQEIKIAQDVKNIWGPTSFVLNIGNIGKEPTITVIPPKPLPKPPIKPSTIELPNEPELLDVIINPMINDVSKLEHSHNIAERNEWLEKIANPEITIDELLPRDKIFIIDILKKPLPEKDKFEEFIICKYIGYTGDQGNNFDYCFMLLKKITSLSAEISREQAILIDKNILLNEMRLSKINADDAVGTQLFALLLTNDDSNLINSNIFDLYEQYKKQEIVISAPEKNKNILKQREDDRKALAETLAETLAEELAEALKKAKASIQDDAEEKSAEPDTNKDEEHKNNDPDIVSKEIKEIKEIIKEDVNNTIEELKKMGKMEKILGQHKSVISNIKKLKGRFSKLDETSAAEAAAAIDKTNENFKHFYNKVYSNFDNKLTVLNNIQNPVQNIIPMKGHGTLINLEPEEKVELKKKILNILKIIPILKGTPLSTNADAAAPATASASAITSFKTKMTKIFKALKFKNKGNQLDEQDEQQALAILDLPGITPAAINNIDNLINNSLIDLVFEPMAPIQDQSIIDLLHLFSIPENNQMVIYKKGLIVPDNDSDVESDVSDVESIEDSKVIAAKRKEEKIAARKRKQEETKKAAENAERDVRDVKIFKMKKVITDTLEISRKNIYILKNIVPKLQNELDINQNKLDKLNKELQRNQENKKKASEYVFPTKDIESKITAQKTKILEIRNKITGNNIELDVETRKFHVFEEKYYLFCDPENPNVKDNQWDWFAKIKDYNSKYKRRDKGDINNIYGLEPSEYVKLNAEKQAEKIIQSEEYNKNQKEYNKNLDNQQEIVKRIIYKLLNMPPGTEINKDKFMVILENLKLNPKNANIAELINDAQQILRGNESVLEKFHNTYKPLLSSFSKTIIHPVIDNTRKASLLTSARIIPIGPGATGPGATGPGATGPGATGPNMCNDISKANEKPFKINYPSMFENMYKLNKLTETIKIRSVNEKIKDVADKKTKLANKTRKTAEHKAKIEKETEEEINAEYWKSVNEKRDNKIRAAATAAAKAKLAARLPIS